MFLYFSMHVHCQICVWKYFLQNHGLYFNSPIMSFAEKAFLLWINPTFFLLLIVLQDCTWKLICKPKNSFLLPLLFSKTASGHLREEVYVILWRRGRTESLYMFPAFCFALCLTKSFQRGHLQTWLLCAWQVSAVRSVPGESLTFPLLALIALSADWAPC